MDKITSQRFFETWCETVKMWKESLVNNWRNPTAFTKLIKGSNDTVLEEIAIKLDLKMLFP